MNTVLTIAKIMFYLAAGTFLSLKVLMDVEYRGRQRKRWEKEDEERK